MLSVFGYAYFMFLRIFLFKVIPFLTVKSSAIVTTTVTGLYFHCGSDFSLADREYMRTERRDDDDGYFRQVSMWGRQISSLFKAPSFGEILLRVEG